MRASSIIMSTVGATAGLVAGNYLYQLDVEANKYREVPVPFYTVRKAASDVSKAAEKTYNDIKSKFTKPEEQQATEAVDVTDEEVAAMLQNEAPVVEQHVEDNSVIVDAEVIDGKAVPVNQPEPEEKQTEEETVAPDPTVETPSQETPATAPEEKVVGNTDDTQIPKFTVLGNQQPVSEASDQKAAITKNTANKATVIKGSKVKNK